MSRKSLLSILSIALALIIVLSFPTKAIASPWSDDYTGVPQKAAAIPQTQLGLDCRAAILMERETGQVLYEMNPDQRMPEASITKVMTMLLVFEALDSGKITMEDTVTCSEYAASMGGSQIWLEPGETMSVHDLIKAAMVGSANDASVVLAEYIGGSHESFVAMMNERAEQLHLDNTAYKNCTGLDADGHVTSARDIATVSAELMRHQEVLEFSTIWMDTLRGGQLQLTNTNKLIRYYQGINGLKTGTTSQAGCCVSATAERDGMTLIAVIMGAPNSKTRFNNAAKLLDYGFACCERLDLSTIDVVSEPIEVICGLEKSAETIIDMSGSVLIPKGKSAEVTATIEMAENVAAPVEYGQTVGKLTLTLDGEVLGTYNILTDRAIEAVTFSNVFELLVDALLCSDRASQ